MGANWSVEARRLPRIATVGLLGSGLVLFAMMCVMHGFFFTLGWLLGSSWPYPSNLQISSAWWLSLGALTCACIQLLLWHRLTPGGRAILFVAGPIAATWMMFSWCASFLFYMSGTWRADGVTSGIRWFLDQPVMSVWRAVAGWLLFQVGVPRTVNPVNFVDGSSVAHVHQSVIALGLLNEAMLAALLATLAVVVVLRARQRSPGHHAV